MAYPLAMRILAGTLYSGENEFDRCVASIRRQTLPAAEHLVVRGLANREAHEALYGTFHDRRNEFDCMIKVDADCVLRRDDFFAGVAELLQARAEVQLLEVRLHDWYTDRPMSGINAYRNTIPWQPSGESVFVDRLAVPPAAVLRDRRRLAPAATHCPDPLPLQAFHFGLHRGVKAVVAAERGMHETAWVRQREIELTRRHLGREPDARLALAVLGGEMGLQRQFGPDQLDYDDPAVRAAFDDVRSLSLDELKRQIEAIRCGDFGRWPWPLRHELRRGGAGLPWRLVAPLPLRVGLGRLARRVMPLPGK